MLDLLLTLLDMHKGTLGVMVKIMFFGWKTVENPYFLHFTITTPCTLFYNANFHKYLSFLEENNFNVNVVDNCEFCAVLFNTD